MIAVREKVSGSKTSGAAAFASAALLAVSYVFVFLTSFFPGRTAEVITGTGGLRAGAAELWNGVCDRFGSAAYILLGKVSVPEGTSGTGPAVLIMLVLFFCLAYLTVYLAGRFGKSLLARLIPALWVVPPALILIVSGIMPSVPAVILFAFALSSVYVTAGLGSRAGFGHFLLPAAAAGLMLIITLSYSAAFGGFPDPASGIRSSVKGIFAGQDAWNKAPDGVALVLAMDDPSPIYLRGKVGEKYSADGWTAFTDEEAYKTLDELYWVRKSGLEPESQHSALSNALRASVPAKAGGSAAGTSPGRAREPGTITVTVKDADGSLMYTPYGLAQSGIDGAVSMDGAYFKKKKLSGDKTYSFKADAGAYAGWTDEVSALFGSDPTDEIDRYLEAEAVYAGFVYGKYLKVSAGERERYAKALGIGDETVERHEGYREAIGKVRAAVTGDDRECASAAASMFRMLGIPARYVEGYIITESDIQGAGQVSVRNSAYHAWPEIYVDGYGWVPVEVTPGFTGLMPEADLDTGFEGIDTRASVASGRESAEAEPEEGAATASGRMVTINALVLILALLLILVLILYRPVVNGLARIAGYSYRRKLFRSPDPRIAVSAMYEYAIEHSAPLSGKARETGRRAAYSKHPVTEVDRQIMMSEIRNSRRLVKKPSVQAVAILLMLAVTVAFYGCSSGAAPSGKSGKTFDSVCAETLMDNDYDKAWTAITLLGELRADGFVKDSETYKRAGAHIDSAVKEIADDVTSGNFDDADGYTQYSKALILLTAYADTDEQEETDQAAEVLIGKLDEYDAVKADGLNSEIFALIAGNYAGIELKNAERYRADIIAHLTEDGALSPDNINEDVDLTAMAAQALPGTPEAEKMLDWLAGLQRANGSYETCESTAQVVIALAMNGRNPAKDKAFTKENDLMEGLLSYTTEDGFCHTYDTAHDDSNVTDLMSTQQGLLALAAAGLAEDGKMIYGR